MVGNVSRKCQSTLAWLDVGDMQQEWLTKQVGKYSEKGLLITPLDI
jgi:hypothetical protein